MTRTPEEIARQDKLDEEYEAALKKWVDSIPKNQALIFKERLRLEPMSGAFPLRKLGVKLLLGFVYIAG
jgi:hypothetical protein